MKDVIAAVAMQLFELQQDATQRRQNAIKLMKCNRTNPNDVNTGIYDSVKEFVAETCKAVQRELAGITKLQFELWLDIKKFGYEADFTNPEAMEENHGHFLLLPIEEITNITIEKGGEPPREIEIE